MKISSLQISSFFLKQTFYIHPLFYLPIKLNNDQKQIKDGDLSVFDGIYKD